MTQEQIDAFNRNQQDRSFHPLTCANDGDAAHCAFEFNVEHPGEDYAAFLETKRSEGVRFPEMMFNETKLIATPDGLKCPVCDYKQSFGPWEQEIDGRRSEIRRLQSQFEAHSHPPSLEL